MKEIFFFDLHFDRGVEWYEHYFAHCRPAGVIGEVSATYFSHPEAPARVAAVCPRAKLIATLRNPIARAWSMYMHRWSKGDTAGSLFEAAETYPEILSEGLYAAPLRRWREHFDPDALLVPIYYEMMAEPAAAISAIYRFVGADDEFRPRSLYARLNQNQSPRNRVIAKLGVGLVRRLHRAGLHELVDVAKVLGAKRLAFRDNAPLAMTLSGEDRERLTEYYADDVGETSEMLGRDLTTAWLKS